MKHRPHDSRQQEPGRRRSQDPGRPNEDRRRGPGGRNNGPPGRRAGAHRPGGRGQARHAPAAPTSWDHVAAWYDRLVGEEGSDYHRNVVLPAAMRMLDPQTGERILDLACGQGVFTRMLARLDLTEILGVDASPALIEAARQRTAGDRVRYAVADVRDLGSIADGRFDGAACILAVHDIDDIAALFRSAAAALRRRGRLVIIGMHPCFRIPRQSGWGWDDAKKTQFRRMERYATAMTIPIATHPGSDPGTSTAFFHRPLSAYLNALGEAGLAVVACEELVSHHTSEPGARSRGENRARREFPLFLALKAVRL